MHKGGVAATKSSSRRRGCLGWAGEIPGQNRCFCRFAELPVHVGPQKRRAYYSLDEAAAIAFPGEGWPLSSLVQPATTWTFLLPMAPVRGPSRSASRASNSAMRAFNGAI
jgi:hypothetical protein